MKVYEKIEHFAPLKHAVVTSGMFDGVHIGHQKILQRLQTIAQKYNGESVVITYWPHPRQVLYPNQHFRLLSSIDEKVELLTKAGVDHLLIIPFTREFSERSSSEYIKEILVKRIGTKTLVIGYNHRFGKNREGSFEELTKQAPWYNFEVEEISKQMVDDTGISSTRVRRALESGDITTANSYLGRPYGLKGMVIAGDKIGSTLGFPTANLRPVFDQKLIPSDGIYAVTVQLGEDLYKGMLNVGYRPTFGGDDRRIEVNIFDFDKDIYNSMLNIYFHSQIRKEEKFSSREALIQQLYSDKQRALQLLNHIH
jgi:riboflavin kinase/FMN adenylyltransferase